MLRKKHAQVFLKGKLVVLTESSCCKIATEMFIVLHSFLIYDSHQGCSHAVNVEGFSGSLSSSGKEKHLKNNCLTFNILTLLIPVPVKSEIRYQQTYIHEDHNEKGIVIYRCGKLNYLFGE